MDNVTITLNQEDLNLIERMADVAIKAGGLSAAVPVINLLGKIQSQTKAQAPTEPKVVAKK